MAVFYFQNHPVRKTNSSEWDIVRFLLRKKTYRHRLPKEATSRRIQEATKSALSRRNRLKRTERKHRNLGRQSKCSHSGQKKSNHKDQSMSRIRPTKLYNTIVPNVDHTRSKKIYKIEGHHHKCSIIDVQYGKNLQRL